MSVKIIVLLSILTISNAIPVWIVNNPIPTSYVPNRLSPALPPVLLYNNPQYASSSANAQNLGQSGSAISLSQTENDYSQAIASAQNNNPGLWSSQSALSSAENSLYGSALSNAQSSGLGYGSAVSAADNAPGFQSAISLANRQSGPWNYENAFAAAQNNGAYKVSVADAVQQNGNLFQKSGANSISAPGLQAANAHAIQSGF